MIGKRYYEPEWDGVFNNIDPAHDDVDRFSMGLRYLGTNEEEISELKDPTTTDVRAVLTQWNKQASQIAKLADPYKCLYVVYYSGHGVTGKNAKQYLVLEKDSLICIDELVRGISRFSHCYVLVIYDACRNTLNEKVW